MSLSNIFPETPFSDTEEVLISEIFNNPVVKKYLRRLALSDTKELLSVAAITRSDTEVAKALAKVQGRLEIIGTLLSIEVVTQNPNQSTK